jgi:hypothetical protein
MVETASCYSTVLRTISIYRACKPTAKKGDPNVAFRQLSLLLVGFASTDFDADREDPGIRAKCKIVIVRVSTVRIQEENHVLQSQAE